MTSLTPVDTTPRPRKRTCHSVEVDDAAAAPKCVLTYSDFDWRGDQPLRHAWEATVIYELHVRGYTVDPAAGVSMPGTYRGLTEKIPYLKDLGVTAVELMPVQEFNENHLMRVDPQTGERLRNYWGYDPALLLRAQGILRQHASRQARRCSSSRRWCGPSIRPASK